VNCYDLDPAALGEITATQRKRPMMADPYQPKLEHKFSFGLWTVGNPGRDPFGEPVRAILLGSR
jgi:hypothetical protein